jgi:hypothetical protein
MVFDYANKIKGGIRSMKEVKKGYLIHNNNGLTYRVCKILNEYDTEEEANEDLLNLLSGETTEKELIKEFQ